MIASIEGVLKEKIPTRVVIQVQGIGYEIAIPVSTYDRLPATEQVCRLLIHDYFREDAHLLFGFSTPAERELFGRLLNVSGIGPKTALSALSGMSVREFKAAVVGNDVKRLSSISGIGKKTAERLVVELRDKISAGEALEAVAGAELPTEENKSLRDALSALVSLGYKQADALKMVRAAWDKLANPKATTEEIIRHSLMG